jgi:hypothetical protein
MNAFRRLALSAQAYPRATGRSRDDRKPQTEASAGALGHAAMKLGEHALDVRSNPPL